MEGETASFLVRVNESPLPSRLLLSPGLAMLISNETFASQSFQLQSGKLKIDYHESTGHLRFSQSGQQGDATLAMLVVSQTKGPNNLSAIPGTESLSLSTQACLSALKRYYKSDTNAEDPITPSPPPDYQVSIARAPKVISLPSEPLKMAATESKDWAVARITDFAPGSPSTGFTVASRLSNSILESLMAGALHSSGSPDSSFTSSASMSTSSKSPGPTTSKPRTGPLSLSNAEPILRIRLHPSFAALSARLQASNPKMPAAPSNWRRDLRVLQQELDQWLTDVLHLDPLHPALIAFFADEDDVFTPAPLGSSSSGYISLAFSSMMEAKPYRQLFKPSTAPKPMVSLFGASKTGKSALVNHIIGFPICDPDGATKTSAGMCATVYEVLSPAAFSKVATLSSYWTHSLQFGLSSYPPGSEVLVVAPEKLQEPIHRLQTSWKRGGAFVLLEHEATLARYKFAPNLGHVTCRTVLVNEAALDPIRMEYEVARNNVFVEFNNFEHLTDDFGETPQGDDTNAAESLKASDWLMSPEEEKQLPIDGFVNATPTLPLHLIEIAHFLTKSTRILHFGSFSDAPRMIKDGWMLEIAELLSANSVQFYDKLAEWIQSATPTERPDKKQLDLLKLLTLMSQWLLMLPTPRKQRHMIFMTPLTSQEYLMTDQLIEKIAPFFKIHNILASSARVLATRGSVKDSSSNSGGANLVVSVNHSAPLSASTAYSQVDAFDFLLPTEARDHLFQKALTRSKI